jgi:pseudouridine-5'-phosphate glycosidase
MRAAAAAGVRGKDVTPFLLDYFHRESGGETLRANIRIVVRNAELAGQVAAELAGQVATERARQAGEGDR